MKNRLNAVSIVVLSVLFLVSCGGGGGSGSGGGNGGGTSSQAPLLDTDGDGTPDVNDTDDDNDGVLDSQDAFPLNKAESLDSDGDGIGNNVDTDDDGDGLPDTKDAFPLDKSEWVDFDGDGIGDNADTDDDNDGILDTVDTNKSVITDLPNKLPVATKYLHDISRDYIYITHRTDLSLSVLDAKTGKLVKSIKFDQMPESMYLASDNSKLYVTLVTQDHNYYWFDNQLGYVVTIDLNTFEKKSTLTLTIDPYDLVVTSKGKLIVSGGSGQWTNISAYDLSTGSLLGSAMVRQMSSIALSKNENTVYAMDTDGSSSLQRYDITGVSITAGNYGYSDYTIRYEGKLWVTPDGKYLITKGGDVLLADDFSLVSHLLSFSVSVRDITFDAASQTAFLSLTDNTVQIINLNSLESINTFSSFGQLQTAIVIGDYVYSLVTQSGVTSIVKQDNPCSKCASNKSPKAAFTLTPPTGDTTKTFVFDAASSSDPDGDSLSYRWDIDGDGIWDTSFSSNSKYEKRFNVPGTKYIRVQVKDAGGSVSTQTQSLDVAQGIDTGTTVVDSIANLLNFSITDLVTDKINSKIYISDKNAKRVYVVDYVTGVTEKYFSFDDMPENLSLSPDGTKLFVSVLSKNHGAYYWGEDMVSYVAVIDTKTQTSVKTFAVKKDIYNIAAISNDRIIISGNSNQQSTDIQTYDANTGLALGISVAAYPNGKIAVNSTGNTIFFVDSYIKKYDVNGATPVLSNQNDYSINYRVGNRVWPTPDGKYLITQGGDIVTVSDLKLFIAKTPSYVTINNVAFDSSNQIATLTLSDGSVDVINLISLESIKKITALGYVSNISFAGSSLYMVSTLAGASSVVKLDHPCLDCASNKPPVAAFTYSPLSSGNTASIYQFNATTSSDPENNSLSYRWDLDGDGVWDADFTSTGTASRKYIIAGTKNIRLQVKDSKGLTTILSGGFVVAQGTDTGVTVSDSVANQFSFKVTDSLVDTVRGKLYVSDKTAKRLYVVDVLTGLTDKYFEFEYLPENMAISVDGTKLYLALLLKEHSYYSWDQQLQAGYVAVIDLASAAHVNTLAIDIDPYDLAVTSDNHLVVSAASSQSTTFHVYDASTGQPITDFASINNNLNFALDTTTNFAYFTNYGSLSKIDIAGSTHAQSSSSNSELAVGKLWLTPDRKYIITQGGGIFNTNDLSLVKRLTASATAIELVSFDAQAQLAFLSLSSGYLQTINLVSQESVTQTKLTGTPGISAIFNSSLYILNIASNSVALIKQDHPCPSCLTNIAPTAKFAFIASTGNTTDTYHFNASTSTDPEASTLSYRWDLDGDNVWDTEWASSALKEYKFILPGNKLVRVQVKDAQGAVNSYSQAFSVAQGTDTGIVVAGSTAFSLNLTATDVIKDAGNAKLYVSDAAAKRVYIIDLATGFTEKYFEFQYAPERMTLSADGKFIYLSLPLAAHSPYTWSDNKSGYIAVIDTAQQSYVRTFSIEIDPYDVAMTKDNRLAVTTGYGQTTTINLYNATTGELIGNSYVYSAPLLAANPVNSLVFALDSIQYLHKYETQGSNLQDLGTAPYYSNSRIYGDIWVTPDGKYIITGGGDILLTSNMTFVRGLTATNVSIKALTFDEANNLLVIVNSNLELVSYDLTTLVQKSVIKTGVAEPKAIYVFSGSVYLIKDSNVNKTIDKILIP